MHPALLNLVNKICYNDVNITTDPKTAIDTTNGFNLIRSHIPHFKDPIIWLSIPSDNLSVSKFNMSHVTELGSIINDFQSNSHRTQIDLNDILILTQFNVSYFIFYF